MAYGLQWTREEPRVRRYHEWEVFRSADDPNDVVVLQDVADVAKARTWIGSDDLKAAIQKDGVLGSPSIRFAA
jgi:hypothetical protein